MELLRRQPKHTPNTQEKVEQEFKRRVTNMMVGPLNGNKVQEKCLKEWTNELPKVAQEKERRLEARDTRQMSEEDGNRSPRKPGPAPF